MKLSALAAALTPAASPWYGGDQRCGDHRRWAHHCCRQQSGKLQLATKLGATDIVDVRNGDPVEQVKELTKGQVHHAIEAVGAKVTAEQAYQMLGPGGVATIIGMIPFGTKIELHGFDFLRGEKKMQGSSMG